MTKPAWYRWPENLGTGYVPWFVILRRLIFYPLVLTGSCVAFVGVLGGFGLYEAKRFWKDL